MTSRQQGLILLRQALGQADAEFRPGQWEAIDALVNQRGRLLVVERTGWGKSSVYFIATRILRDRGAGPTLIVSPLLALMRNQVEAAARLGIEAVTIHSGNQKEWPELMRRILANQADALLISPERLSNDVFVSEVLLPVAAKIGLMVVDEAHCISDWGHDFRPDYRRLVNVLQRLPANLPVLCTTATANDRVTRDIRSQLGEFRIQRGTLMRESLELQTLRLPDQSARLAWLAEHLSALPGTGIVYTLTTREAELVAEWLRQHGIEARAYYGNVEHPDFDDSGAYRQHLETALQQNRLKALVATTALGMGYDKPDLGFVVHYQAPGSIVAYYQQVGRAGRAIARAVGVLLAGREDEQIQAYFRQSAFPAEAHVVALLDLLEKHEGLSEREIEQHLNLRKTQLETLLKFLATDNPAPLFRDKNRWLRTPVAYRIDQDKIRRLTRQREQEWAEMQAYIDSETCLMSFLRRALDDPGSADCGKCAVCLGRPIVSALFSASLAAAAKRYLKQAEMPLKCKAQVAADAFPLYGLKGNLPKALRAEEGRILSRWGDAGWGRAVADDKHAGRFRDQLVEAVVDMIRQRWRPEPAPNWVCCIPSLNHPELVPDFAARVAQALGLPFVAAIRKLKANAPQKLQQNRFHQCHNLDGAFGVEGEILSGPVLLIDDVVDSCWTLTVGAVLLRQAGSGPVWPLALATSSTAGD